MNCSSKGTSKVSTLAPESHLRIVLSPTIPPPSILPTTSTHPLLTRTSISTAATAAISTHRISLDARTPRNIMRIPRVVRLDRGRSPPRSGGFSGQCGEEMEVSRLLISARRGWLVPWMPPPVGWRSRVLLLLVLLFFLDQDSIVPTPLGDGAVVVIHGPFAIGLVQGIDLTRIRPPLTRLWIDECHGEDHGSFSRRR